MGRKVSHITLSTLFLPIFEFSLKLKVMGLNPGYLLKFFLLYSQKYLEQKVAHLKKYNNDRQEKLGADSIIFASNCVWQEL